MIDNIDGNILLQNSSVVKSVQSGVRTVSGSVRTSISISPVNVSKSVLIINVHGFYSSNMVEETYGYIGGTLTSSSISLTGTMSGGAYGSSSSATVSWTVIEFY